MANNRAKFLAELKAELAAEGYEFISLRNRELRVRAKGLDNSGQVPTVEIYAQRRMGEGVNNSFTKAWPPGFEFCGSEKG